MNCCKNLKGKIALVTGASKGIGRAIAIRLAEEGADVAVNYNSDLKGAEATAAIIKGKGGKCIIIQADVSENENVNRMFNCIRSNLGAVDILVNNAGISPLKSFLDYTEEEIMLTIGTNLLGAIFCAKEALIYMIAKRSGKIINISSVHSVSTEAGRAPYAASKGGMDSFTRALAVEFGNLGIQVNSLVVGAITNERTLKDVAGKMQEWEGYVPAGRWGTCEEIAEAVLFLSGPASNYINGSCIRIDSGQLSQLSAPGNELTKLTHKMKIKEW